MVDISLLEGQSFLKTFKNAAIYKIYKNYYGLFDKYKLTTETQPTIHRFSDSTEYIFSSVQTAIAWATLDHLNKINDASELLSLDHQVSGILFEIQVHKRIAKNANSVVSQTKLDELNYKMARLNNKIKTYVNRTHNWQMRQFEKKV